MTETAEVLIAGGGIGGLTAALTLNARGITSTVIDGARELTPLGVGINLLPHAVRELDELGLGRALADIAVAPTKISFFSSEGDLLFQEPRGIAGGYAYPQYSVHRGELHMLLLATVRDRLGPDAVLTGTRLSGFDDSPGVVTAHTSRGEMAAHILIGADGVHSVVRAQLHPENDQLMWSGVRMFRGATPAEPFLDGQTMAIVKGPAGVDLITYPIGGGLTNWVLQVPESTPGPLPGDAGWNVAADVDAVAARVSSWQLDWLDPAAMVRASSVAFEYPMVDRDALPWWGTGNVTLLGDAAHPMYPVGANGGSQAILDARVLADELLRDFGPGLRTYEDNRRAATAEIVAANREMHASGVSRRREDLAAAAAKYRRDTKADGYASSSLTG
ncbi:FAD-dependent monooxygenase [Mycolicibacterium komossense]|uniref:FAD-dependent monooxygenase n=1 Tax=Mycolicibacterium komossense TaxID=1779 RepID=A0ABT3CB46_9MYCO|nr:FAD-dependent monooxygenase [Mycolicibacterium komossense]MCV7226690.1 FAD-dependent monooxygenase [Mycolicibacterium komossense]